MTTQTPQLVKMKDWMRKSSMHFFKRNQDAVAAPSFVQIGNRMVADAMASGFEAVSRDTFFVTCRARQILSQNLKGKIYKEEEIFAAETALDERFERAHEHFGTRIMQAEQKLAAAGFDPQAIERHVMNYETKSVTNGVTQYLDLMGKADYYVTLLHYLWVTGELSDSQDEARRAKLNAERETRQQLFAIPRASTAHYNNIRRICNGVIEHRKKEREAQSVRDRLRALEKDGGKAHGFSPSPADPLPEIQPEQKAGDPDPMQTHIPEEALEEGQCVPRTEAYACALPSCLP